MPTTGDGDLLSAAAGSISDIDSKVGDLKPKIKRSSSTEPVSKVDSLRSDDSFTSNEVGNPEIVSHESKCDEEPLFRFEPMPPFEGLNDTTDASDMLQFTDGNVPDEFELRHSPAPDMKSPPKCDGDVDTKIDPRHLLQPSPVSPGLDDMEPFPLSQQMIDPYPLSGPFAEDFVSLFDEIVADVAPSNTEVKAVEVGKAKQKTVAKKSQAAKYPQPHHAHWHPYHAPYHAPPGYGPHPGYYYAYPYPYSIPYGRTGHRTLIESVKNPEAATIKKDDVTDNDVICGRGGKVNNHPGNKRFREFISQHKLDYLNASKIDKPALADKILEKVKPGRFLVQISGGYVECDDCRAREKASQALREGAAKLRKEGYALPDQALKPSPKIKLPSERTGEVRYSHDPVYCEAFEPPCKKFKTE